MNPWASNPNPFSQMQQGQQRLQAMGNEYQQAAQPEPYPSFQNSMGLGSQSAYSSPGSSFDASTSTAATSPWLFKGEAFSR